MPLGNYYVVDKKDTIMKSKFLMNQLKLLGYNGKVKINCAMKEDFDIKDGCNMLSERKVGLDQCGNLYTCIWASDIKEDKTNSPFYLGNLLEENLSDILSSDKVMQYISKLTNNRDKCYVLEHFYNKLENQEI